jgi:hypothetical protein
MNATNAFTPAPLKPIISPEVLDSIDIRVGTIERVEDVAKSGKLVKLRRSHAVHFGRDEEGASGPQGDRGQAGALRGQPAAENDGG